MISTLTAMVCVMIQLYILIEFKNIPEMAVAKILLFNFMVQALTQLNANCIINGWTHDGSEQLLRAVDTIDVLNTLPDDPTFREVMLFMAMNRDSKIGFTIGGLMPLRKSTLLSVSK